MQENTIPKVFISYSWSSPTHENWVINLAERLVSNGVHVIIDKWDLKEGHDSYSFMESMVQSSDIEKVLIILDEKYTSKANGKKGGVGTETQIISPQIYGNVVQDKFIPIVTQCDEYGKAYIPTYLTTRIYIDLSKQEHFEAEYEKLLRSIFKRPALSRPKLGTPPSYLFEDTPITFKTTFILRGVDSSLTNNPSRVNATISDFLQEFSNNLADFKVTISDPTYEVFGKQIVDSIHQYTPLRDDFVGFFDKIIKSGIDFNLDLFVRFLEKTYSFTQPDTGGGGLYEAQFDNYKFILHELFLYVIAVCLKNERYDLIEQILLSRYFVSDRYNNSDSNDFHTFYSYISSIDTYYKKTYSRNFYSPMADLMVTRIPDNFTKDLLVNADLVCHYVGEWNDITWFPITYVYKSREAVDFFRRIISQRHFEKVKGLFNVKTASEFAQKLQENESKSSNANGRRYPGSFESITPIYHLIDVEKIATAR